MEEIKNNKEYLKAKELIKEYEEKISSSIIKSKVCIICREKTIEPFADFQGGNPLLQHQNPWNDGTVTRVDFGFGSRYDMKSFFVGICDNCIDNAVAFDIAEDVETIKAKMERNNL